MLFIFHIAQCFIFMSVQSIKFNGSCPALPAEDHFNCNDSIGNLQSFYPMAHLPISNNSLNVFFNPFNRLECLGITIRCLPEAVSRFHMEILCIPDDEDAVEFCSAPLIQLPTKTVNASIDFNFVTDYDEICPRILQDVKLVKFVANQYFIFYGCTDDNGEHEEGAWIFGSKSNLNESMNRLDEAFDYLKNSSARAEDFKVYNISTIESSLTGFDCGCHYNQTDSCEFFSRCKIEGENSYYYYEYDEDYGE